MKTLTFDVRLADALAALCGYLRVGSQPRLDATLRASADGFIDALADHLRREEEFLVPALHEASPDSDEALEPLSREHDGLRELASRLAGRMAENDREEAAEVAQEFLGALLRHLTRAERALDTVLDHLPPETTDRLLRRLGPRWTEED